MTSDEQEALSRRHDSDGIVILLRLSSGRFAVYNNARELCAIVPRAALETPWDWPPAGWRPTATAPKQQTVDLKELGLE